MYQPPQAPTDELALAEIKSAILAKLTLAIGKEAVQATKHDWYKAAALALRDRIVHRRLVSEKESYDAGRKRVYYLSLEFLIGRLFTDAPNCMMDRHSELPLIQAISRCKAGWLLKRMHHFATAENSASGFVRDVISRAVVLTSFRAAAEVRTLASAR